MRNMIVAAVVVLFLAACGTTTQQAPDAEPTEVGYLTFDFRPALRTAQAEYPEPTGIRVVITHEDSGYRLLEDFVLPIDSVGTITVPARDNYSITAFSYLEDRTYKQILKDAKVTGVDVVSTQTTEVEMTLSPVTFTITGMPEQVVAGESYSFSAVRDSAMQYLGYYWVATSTEPFQAGLPGDRSITSYSGAGNAATFTLNTLPEHEGRLIYHMVILHAASMYLAPGENNSSVFASGPVQAFGQAPAATEVIPTNAPGNIDLIVIY